MQYASSRLSQFLLGMLMMLCFQASFSQTAGIRILDGAWTSREWKYGYRLSNGLGIATQSNSASFRPGDRIIELQMIAPGQFSGRQIYKDGKFYNVNATLMPDGRLYFKGEKNVTWYMERDMSQAPVAAPAPAPAPTPAPSNLSGQDDALAQSRRLEMERAQKIEQERQEELRKKKDAGQQIMNM